MTLARASTVVAAADLLVEGERCAPDLGAACDDFEHIVEAAGLQIVDLDAAHDEDRWLAVRPDRQARWWWMPSRRMKSVRPRSQNFRKLA